MGANRVPGDVRNSVFLRQGMCLQAGQGAGYPDIFVVPKKWRKGKIFLPQSPGDGDTFTLIDEYGRVKDHHVRIEGSGFKIAGRKKREEHFTWGEDHDESHHGVTVLTLVFTLKGCAGPTGKKSEHGRKRGQDWKGCPGIWVAYESGRKGSKGCRGKRGRTGPTGASFTGPTGAGFTGPTGPGGETAVYAQVWNNIYQTIEPCDEVGTEVAFNSAGSSILSGITFDNLTALTLPVSGVYEATFTIAGDRANPDDLANLSFKLRLTTVSGPKTIPGSIFWSNADANDAPNQLVGNVKFRASAGDVVELVNNTLTEIELREATGTVPSGGGITLGSHNLRGVVGGTSIASGPLFIEALSTTAIYVAVQTDSGQTALSVTDNNAVPGPNTYTLVGNTVDGPNTIQIFRADNVPANLTGLTVTATLSGVANAQMEVVELRGVANPSLDPGSFTGALGSGLTPSATTTTSSNGDLGLLAVMVDPKVGSMTFGATLPNFVVDASPPVDNAGQTVAGALVGQQLGAAGSHRLAADITGTSGTTVVPWLTLGVGVRAAVVDVPQTFCETPNNASLDIVLLQAL